METQAINSKVTDMKDRMSESRVIQRKGTRGKRREGL
jgi:hypothetical protein